MRFFLLLGLIVPFTLWALSGSTIDTALSPVKKKSDQIIEKSFKLKLSRNMRKASQDLLDINQKNNIFDTLSVSADLTIGAPLKGFSLFEHFGFLNNKSFQAVLSYNSPVLYNNSKIKEDHCWGAVFCLNNLGMGIFSPLFKESYFHGTSSVYLNLPVSKFRVQKQSFFLGIGASLNMEYKIFSHSGFYVFALSSHFFDLDGYIYRTEKDHRNSNKPLSMAHQLGLQFYYSPFRFAPVLYVYGAHGSSLRFSGVFQQQINVSLSAVWLVGKKLRLLAGLRWGDEVLSENILAPTERKFFADDTYVTFGGSYLF